MIFMITFYVCKDDKNRANNTILHSGIVSLLDICPTLRTPRNFTTLSN